ncbi:unnamed protein product, partial [Ectocarpus sp. 4 AP-2014]
PVHCSSSHITIAQKATKNEQQRSPLLSSLRVSCVCRAYNKDAPHHPAPPPTISLTSPHSSSKNPKPTIHKNQISQNKRIHSQMRSASRGAIMGGCVRTVWCVCVVARED